MRILLRIGKILFALLVIGVLSGVVYYNRANYKQAYENVRLAVGLDKPCSRPITYSIGTLDTRFGQSQAQFVTNMNKATMIWNNVLGKELFKYVEIDLNGVVDSAGKVNSNNSVGDLQVNLIYDSRQQTTVQMNSIGTTIESGKSSYDDLKASYNSLQSSYNSQKSTLQSLMTKYESDKAVYEKDVDYWNGRGGAPKKDYADLQNKQAALNAQVASINTANKKLNDTVRELNSVADSLNALGKQINQNVVTYNRVSTSNGPEFQEGEFVSDREGERINIYQYNDNTKLIRVLAHEFGHALGLDHVTDPKAIMYAYNMDTNETPTEDDVKALKAVCGVK